MTATNPPSPETVDFLARMFAACENGWVTLFTIDPAGKRHTWWEPTNHVADLAAVAARLHDHNIWFGPATRFQRLPDGRRGGKKDCSEIVALWLDLDVEGPGHAATGVLPNEDQAYELINDFPLQPTVIIHSGHGLQAWWHLVEPHELAGSDILARWGATWARRADEAGFRIDNVFDEPRVMRLPGTVNTKPGCDPAPVTIEVDDWRKTYGADDIEPWLDPTPTAPANHDTVPYIGPDRPGDAYNARHDINELLRRLGFVEGRKDRDGAQHWNWPAAAGDQSATSYPDGHCAIWSETAAQQLGIKTQESYLPFGLYTATQHRGDYSAAAKELAANGYGTPRGELSDLIATSPTQSDDNQNEPADATILFHDWTPRELLDADTGFTWLIEGMYAMPTYGMTAGESKTAKTTVGAITQMSLAAGIPVLGHFTVPKPRPVIIYVGEGGRIPHTRLMTRIAEALSIDWRDLPIYPRHEIAGIMSIRFQATLARDLEKYEPGLVVVDPYYAFHGSNADSKNLHEEAEVLNSISTVCVEAGAVLDITNHFNRNEGKGLRRITMAGGAEWVDTWRLVEHREPPDIDNGQLKLRLDIGSRQWGGSVWDLDLNLGRFQPALGLYDGPISWDLRRPGKPADDRVDKVLVALELAPYAYSKEELAKLIGGRITDARHLVDHLENTQKITPKLVKSADTKGRERKKWAYGLTERPTWDDELRQEG